MTALKPYPEYKVSAVAFLGQVPLRWSVQPAVTLARVLTSTVDKHTVEGEVAVRLCNYTDVYYSDEIVDPAGFMLATATRDQIREYSAEAGDVVFTKDSETADDIGISAYVPESLDGVVYGYHLSTYRPIDPRYGKFLKWLLDSKYAKATFRTRTLGVTRVGLSQNTVRYLRVPTPSPGEAQAIADFLDRETAEIDAFIVDQEELIGLLTERRAALHTRTFERVVDLGVEGGRGVPLSRALTESDERVGTEDREMLSVSIHRGVVAWNDLHDKPPKAESFATYKEVNPRDVVLNRMRAFQGAAGAAHTHGMVSPDYAVFRVAATSDADYIGELLRSAPMIEAIKLRLRGIGDTDSGAVRTPRVNSWDLLRIRVSAYPRLASGAGRSTPRTRDARSRNGRDRRGDRGRAGGDRAVEGAPGGADLGGGHG